MDGPRPKEAPLTTEQQPSPGRLTGIRQRILERLRPNKETTPSQLHPGVYEPPEREMIGNHDTLRSLSAGDAAYEFSPQDWTEWMSRNIEDIRKEPREIKRNAGILIHELVIGVEEMYQEHLSRGNPFSTKPSISLGLYGNSASSGMDGTRIEVTKQYLLEKARKPLDTPVADLGTFSDTQTPAFYGTPRQDVRIM